MNDVVRVNGSEQYRGSVVLGDPNTSPLEPPSHARKLVRKKTPPYEASDTSDSSIVPMPKSPRVRSKRHQTRPANLHLHDTTRKSSADALAVAWPEDSELAITPKASSFEGDSPFSQTSPRRRKLSSDEVERVRKLSSEGHDPRQRKVSTGSRTRKISAETKEAVKRTRDIAAEEGDDEGYDDLLSAYESEEGSKMSLR